MEVRITNSGLVAVNSNEMRKMRDYSPWKFERPIRDLLFDERKGKFLTVDEKNKLKKYAQERRKKNLQKAN